MLIGFVFVVGFMFVNPPLVSAGWVDGYYKSNGTYVNGYWKSNPNGLKYDNYSFDGNWSDAYNDTYFSSTKNYSADWYKPTWVTQENYYVGKSYYDSRNSYSTYTTNKDDYTYKYWDDPIYSYKPTYNYGYDYLDSFSTYKSNYFDKDIYNSYKAPTYDYSTPSYNSYTTPSYNSYTTPTYNSYTTPTYNSYTTPTYNSYTTPTYNSYTTPTYTTPSYNSYSNTCYYSC